MNNKGFTTDVLFWIVVAIAVLTIGALIIGAVKGEACGVIEQIFGGGC